MNEFICTREIEATVATSESACYVCGQGKSRSPLILVFRRMTLLALACLLQAGLVEAAESFLPDRLEILSMPRLCQYMYGARAGLEPALVPRSPGIDTTGCSRYHYYCDAHTDLTRAVKARYSNRGRAKEKFERALETLRGQVKFHASVPTCSRALQADINFTLGNALLQYAGLLKSAAPHGEAIAALNRAIELYPTDLRAYRVLSELYAQTNERRMAQETIYRGLMASPTSTDLADRYRKLGGEKPLPTEKKAFDEKEEAPDETAARSVNRSGDAEITEQLDGTETLGSDAAESSDPAGRSCRFCPPEEIQHRWIESFKSTPEKKPE